MQSRYEFASEWKKNLDIGDVEAIMKVYDKDVVVVAQTGGDTYGTKELRPVVHHSWRWPRAHSSSARTRSSSAPTALIAGP
jgi:ketosteroid isomerase-like protein